MRVCARPSSTRPRSLHDFFPCSNMPNRSVAVVVFARMPVPGRAKTRLAAGVGPAAAAEFYRLCAQLTFCSAYSCTSADATVFCSSAEDVTAMQHWLQQNSTPMPVRAQQQTADLGRRMLAALITAATGDAGNTSAAAAEPAQHCSCKDSGKTRAEDTGRAVAAPAIAAASASPAGSIADPHQRQAALPQHQEQQQQQQQKQQGSREEYSAVMVIGTDIPDLSAAVLDAAVAALATHDAVLGPARDGGFYLMGFKTAALLKPEVQSGQVFEGVEWSTDSVLQRTMAGVQRLGLKLAPTDTLPVLQDVDTLQDLQGWYKQPGLEQQQQQQQDVLSAQAGGKQVQPGWQEREQQQHRRLLLQHARELLAMQ